MPFSQMQFLPGMQFILGTDGIDRDGRRPGTVPEPVHRARITGGRGAILDIPGPNLDDRLDGAGGKEADFRLGVETEPERPQFRVVEPVVEYVVLKHPACFVERDF